MKSILTAITVLLLTLPSAHAFFFSIGNADAARQIIEKGQAAGVIEKDAGTSSGSGPAATSTPGNLYASFISNTQVRIYWTDHTTNESGFSIERSAGTQNSFAEVASVTANTTQYLDSSLQGNTTYFYRVRAVRPSGYTPYSNVAQILTSGIFMNPTFDLTRPDWGYELTTGAWQDTWKEGSLNYITWSVDCPFAAEKKQRFPNAKILRYDLVYGLICDVPSTLADLYTWIDAHGYDREDFFLHQYALTGGNDGLRSESTRFKYFQWLNYYYGLNMAEPRLRNYFIDRWSGFFSATPALDGIMVDVGSLDLMTGTDTIHEIHYRDASQRTAAGEGTWTSNPLIDVICEDKAVFFETVQAALPGKYITTNIGNYWGLPNITKQFRGLTVVHTEFALMPNLDAEARWANVDYYLGLGKILIYSTRYGVYTTPFTDPGIYATPLERAQMTILADVAMVQPAERERLILGYHEAYNTNFPDWVGAALKADLGTPLESRTLLTTSGSFRVAAITGGGVYKRAWSKAVVLFRQIGSDSPLTVYLDGNYSFLHWDGSMAPAANTIQLRGGEGVILFPE